MLHYAEVVFAVWVIVRSEVREIAKLANQKAMAPGRTSVNAFFQIPCEPVIILSPLALILFILMGLPMVEFLSPY